MDRDVYVQIIEKLQNAESILGGVGDLSELTTTDKDNLVEAINEVNGLVSGLSESVGTLSGLTTTDKDNLVEAINEVNGLVSGLSEKFPFTGVQSLGTWSNNNAASLALTSSNGTQFIIDFASDGTISGRKVSPE